MRLQQDIARKKLWHGRMPTAGCHALSKLAEKYPQVFNFDPRTKLPPCTICHHASQRKAAAPPETKRQVQPLEEVHFDLFFVIYDEKKDEDDFHIARHIVNMHRL